MTFDLELSGRPALVLRDILADVSSQDFVDEGLISDASATCFLAELIEHSRIDANRDQLARLVAERRPALSPRTPPPHGYCFRYVFRA